MRRTQRRRACIHHDQGRALGHGPDEEGERRDTVEGVGRMAVLVKDGVFGHGPKEEGKRGSAFKDVQARDHLEEG